MDEIVRAMGVSGHRNALVVALPAELRELPAALERQGAHADTSAAEGPYDLVVDFARSTDDVKVTEEALVGELDAGDVSLWVAFPEDSDVSPQSVADEFSRFGLRETMTLAIAEGWQGVELRREQFLGA